VPVTLAGRSADPMLSVRPQFYLHAGLVFMPLTRALAIRLLSNSEINEKNSHILSNSIIQTGDDTFIIVSSILPDEITEGCEPFVGECVKTIDGQEASDLGTIRRVIESGRDPFLVIEFQSGAMLVFDRTAARTATARVMRRLEIPSNYSGDQ